MSAAASENENKNMTPQAVHVQVSLSGWLSSCFPEGKLIVTTKPILAEALPDLLEKVIAQAHKPIPKGGVNILINGMRAQVLIQQNYTLQEGDEVTLIPVVAGGTAREENLITPGASRYLLTF